jgi:hypothetical protein
VSFAAPSPSSASMCDAAATPHPCLPPSTGREPGAPRESSATAAAAFPCLPAPTINPETTYLTRFLLPGRAQSRRAAVWYRTGMSWLLPTPLLLVAAVAALCPPRLSPHRERRHPEAQVTAFAP